MPCLLTLAVPASPSTPTTNPQGHGLTSKQISLCDSFVYIQQYGAGTASLNVAVAASIVLHHFALWAGYQERQRQVRWGRGSQGRAQAEAGP